MDTLSGDSGASTVFAPEEIKAAILEFENTTGRKVKITGGQFLEALLLWGLLKQATVEK